MFTFYDDIHYTTSPSEDLGTRLKAINIVCIVCARPPIINFSIPFTKPLGIVPFTIGTLSPLCSIVVLVLWEGLITCFSNYFTPCVFFSPAIIGWLVLFYGISTFACYWVPNPVCTCVVSW